MSPRPTSKAALAAETWRLLFDFFMLTRPQRDRVLDRMQLTPNDVRALGTLLVTQGSTMRSLAETWNCDASYVTWIVDRLEQRGLVERRAKPGDRRVKLVVLTPQGMRTKAAMLEGMYESPPELLALDRATLQALHDALAQLPRSSQTVEASALRTKRTRK